MARQLKQLYMCTCLDELQKKAACVKLDQSSAKLILKSADKLFAEAEKEDLKGDEERAYYYFFRFINAIRAAQDKEDYKKDKEYFNKLVSKQRFKKAVDRLEALTDSLQKRYGLLKEIEASESAAKAKEYSDALVNTSKGIPKEGTNPKLKADINGKGSLASLSSLNGVVKENGVDKPGVQNGGITPPDLKKLLEQKTKRVLLVDCRDQADFTNNRIRHSNCICIPATVLLDGMSANMILTALKQTNPESWMDWHNRGTFDFIILYDWNSSFDHRSPALNIVYNALTMWDQACEKRKILVVQGGMKIMYYTYPTLLTNPSSANNKLNGNNTSDLPDPPKLDSISYPDLDDTPPKPKAPKPSSAVEPREPNLNNNVVRPGSAGVPVTNHFSQPNLSDGSGVPKSSGGGVTFDRSTKPTRFSSTTRLPNGSSSDRVLPAGDNSDEAIVSTEKTDVKVKEYSQALDAVIASGKEVVKSEKEVLELKDMLSKQQHRDMDLEQKLREKEAENETLRREVDSKNQEVATLKSQYEATLRENKAKQVLPRIRTPLEEEEICAKQVEKERIEAMLKDLRKLKVQRENDSHKNEEPIRPNGMGVGPGADNVAKLPPIASNSGGQNQRAAGGTGPTQLPIISNSNLPGAPTQPNVVTPSTMKPSQPSNLPSSANASISRPAPQDATRISKQKLKDENSEPHRSSALKRSHSHPNIAQSHDDDLSDDLPSGSQPPRINRGLKPAGQRPNVPEVNTTPRRFARNFEVVSSTEKSKTGLKNLGNTCYMNSIIQCLSHTNKLVDYLRNEDYLKEWHPQRSSTKGEATEELAAALKQMHSGHRSIALRDLKATIGKHHFSFRGFEQQDSHEFITILLDWLHEEMNRVPEKSPLKEQKNDGLSDEVASTRAMEDYKRSNNSKISELFCGQQKSCVTCASCNRQSVTFEPFFILSVPIPSSGKKCDIQQCIDFYTTEEALSDWNCVHCKKKVRATKKIDLWRLPPYLIIHLQRFYYDGYWKKRLTEIDFPVDNLNLNQKVLGKDCNNVIDKCLSYEYQLYGVSNHYGTMDSGHYTAYCRMSGPGNWWKFDDQEVSPINSRDVPTAAAYILFYQNRNYRI